MSPAEGDAARRGGSSNREPTAPGDAVEHEVRIAAEPERVWRAWTEPSLIAGWFVERALGRAEPGARVTWAWDRFGIEVEQEVLAADAPARLVLRSPRPSGGAGVLEITLESDEGGGTVVRIVESGFGEGPRADADRAGADTGWVMALAMLRHYVERRFGMAKAEAMSFRPAAVEPAAVGPHFRDPERLAAWLDLEGRPITGEVLVDAGPERLRTWHEIEGALEFKAFPVPDGGCMVGLRVVSWGLPRAEMDRLEPALAAAVERLVVRLR